MAYKLSTRSQERLMGIEPELKEVVYEAIKVTKIDFGVIEGLRTEEKQKQKITFFTETLRLCVKVNKKVTHLLSKCSK